MPNWNDVLQNIEDLRQRGLATANQALDLTRRGYLQQLQNYRNRNIIAYYSGWLSKPGLLETDINDEDKNGFLAAVHKLDRNLGLDLILHTPGGSLAATESIVDYLRKMFGRDIVAIVPQIAMSAGTMLACSCKEILMAKHSNLGPIDPHLRGIPAYGVVDEFRRAFREIKRDKAKIHVWAPILSQYRPTFLLQCENSIVWSRDFVEEQLRTVMFYRTRNGKATSKSIVKKLSSFTGNKAHERHIHVEELKRMGLKITDIEADDQLQDLILTVHHCYMHTLQNSPAFKIIENHLGTAVVKNINPAVQQK